MKYDQATLRALQLVELDILKETQRVCEENGIRYFAMGGTNLGAMRHDGFVPWDDDIDIGMLRDDYERFLRVAPTELASGYTLQWYGTEPAVPVYFAKVRKDNTLFIEPGKEGLDIHQGIFIDVKPFDEVPRDSRVRARYRLLARVWKELFIAKSIRKLTVSVPQPTRALATAFRTALHALLVPVNKDWLFRRYDSHLRRHNGSGSGLWSSRGLKMYECEYTDLMPPMQHAFEGATVAVPANPTKLLESQYGDWRLPAPPEKRHNHEPRQLQVSDGAGIKS